MDIISNEFLSLAEAASQTAQPRSRVEHTSTRALASIEFALHWQSEQARHTDLYVANPVNLWRDYFPPELEAAVLNKPVGHAERLHCLPGGLAPAYAAGDCLDIADKRFNRQHRPRSLIEPRAGRFYPRGFIAGVKDIYSEDMTPFRIGRVQGDSLTADLNHPLAGRELTLDVRILDAWQAGAETGGRASDIAELIAGKGPGMQARWRGEPTDFFADFPFARSDPSSDAEFYAKARLVDHLDRLAIKQVEKLYGRLLPKGARVLDLMTSWKSHLDLAEPAHVTGLGMNAEELAANPRLNQRLLHDLNQAPQLPFADDQFDAAVCTVSVEYLTRPIEVFQEVARVLKPGAPFMLTFSNRYFPPKVIRVWEDCHSFERMGLVLEYFHRADGFRNLATFSLVGLPRPEDDKYADRMAYSDPIYAVWGEKA
ncbi:MAG: methyltransferase domain-containing protein [Hydrogenophilaceae bacterium]|nr:methyltransferase domain-containing protein [Hydrogenophilaceae bacterium]